MEGVKEEGRRKFLDPFSNFMRAYGGFTAGVFVTYMEEPPKVSTATGSHKIFIIRCNRPPYCPLRVLDTHWKSGDDVPECRFQYIRGDRLGANTESQHGRQFLHFTPK